MRSNQNPSGEAVRSADRVAGARMPHMPVEWLDAGSWRLPSGKALAEFALQAGFLAPLLFRADRLGGGRSDKGAQAGSSAITGNVAAVRGKQLDKGESR